MTKTEHRQRTPSMGTIGRKERFPDSRHDPYRAKKKLPDPSQCRTCGVVYSRGRWTWDSSVVGAGSIECPACRRIADNCPAGVVNLNGAFVRERGDEIGRIISNVEASERGGHPLERTMSNATDDEGAIRVTTTGIHLACRIGEALHGAYAGELDVVYGDGEYSVRVVWSRD